MIKFYSMTKSKDLSVNFRNVIVVSGFYANQATNQALICLSLVLLLAGTVSMLTLLRQYRLQWLGHIHRIDGGCIPKDPL